MKVGMDTTHVESGNTFKILCEQPQGEGTR